MKTTLWSILLLLLITSTLATAASEQNADAQPNNTVQVSSADNEAKVTTENPRVTGHKITSSELEALKAKIGVYEEGKNYSQLVDGYGASC
jgi:uncharacterized protein (DUF342 family)